MFQLREREEHTGRASVSSAKTTTNSKENQHAVDLNNAGPRNVVNGGEVVHEVESGRDGDGGSDADGPILFAGIADNTPEVPVNLYQHL